MKTPTNRDSGVLKIHIENGSLCVLEKVYRVTFIECRGINCQECSFGVKNYYIRQRKLERILK